MTTQVSKPQTLHGRHGSDLAVARPLVRPPDKCDMVMLMARDGQFAGFERVILETVPGTDLGADAARSLATSFLNQRTTARQHLVEQRAQDRPNGLDYVFPREQDGFRLKDATWRR